MGAGAIRCLGTSIRGRLLMKKDIELERMLNEVFAKVFGKDW
jgi:fructose-1,6-bisphosphatase/sedoheptulose 1,7-bisphosphatase-like protein